MSDFEAFYTERVNKSKQRLLFIMDLAEQQVEAGKMTEKEYIDYCDGQKKLMETYDTELYKDMLKSAFQNEMNAFNLAAKNDSQ